MMMIHRRIAGHEIAEPYIEYRHQRGTFRIPLLAWVKIFLDNQDFARDVGARYPRSRGSSIERMHDAQILQYAREHDLLDDA